MHNQLEQLTQQIDQLTQERDAIAQDLESANAQIQTLTQQVQELEANNQSLNEQLNNELGTIEINGQLCYIPLDAAAALEAERQQFQERIDELQAELEQLTVGSETLEHSAGGSESESGLTEAVAEAVAEALGVPTHMLDEETEGVAESSTKKASQKPAKGRKKSSKSG